MENLSTGDALATALAIRDQVGVQFQYWLTITFAAIVAAHMGRNTLRFKLKIGVATLYLLASVLFLTNYLTTAVDYLPYRNLIIARGGSMNDSYIALASTFILRVALFIVGTSLTIWFLFRTDGGDAD